MKSILHLRSLFVFPVLAICAGVAPSRADYATTFSEPPFVVDESIVGIDGWESRFAPKDDQPSHAARVVAVRWNDNKPALMLRGAELKRTAFGTMSGEKLRIRFSVAVNFAGSRPSKSLRIIFWPSTFGEVFFDDSPEGGFGYQGDGFGKPGQGTVVLKRSEVKINSFYTFTLALDFGKQTFDLSVEGEKKDGSPFSYKAAGVEFLPSKSRVSGIGTLLILGTGYLGSLSIESQ